MRSILSIGSHARLAKNAFTYSAFKPASLLVATRIARPQFGSYNATLPLKSFYSTNTSGTAPPPPPPPPNSTTHDKNARGKVILNRISRAFTFSMSSLMVIGASGVALLVIYLILSELFLPSGDTRTFNKAVKLVEQNENAQRVLGFESGSRLKAYGESYGDKWTRNRPVQSMKTKGQDGKDRLLMKFHVESDSGRHGTVSLEQVDESFWKADFAYIALDTPGNKRMYIIEPKFQSKNYVPKLNGGGFLGLKWGPKKED
ncbi:mitochondrial import inner membrane translocase subunit Tim21p [[Candida] anglica]|uniref:Mitochondrial import inner membrane translocase subunit Tim21 n=1 Tax=[Candida] anglica TaxID=148631 RepID=A0ABP0EMF1_9ASCO